MSGEEAARPAAVERASIRPMTTADVDFCTRLEAVLFAADGPWSAAFFESALDRSDTDYRIIELDGEPVGYAGLARLGPRGFPEFEVHTIGIAPELQGAGLGAALLDELLRLADGARPRSDGGSEPGAVFLEVRTDNDVARRLYESRGFEVLGIRKRYYSPSGADAFSMRRAPRIAPR